MTYIFAKTISLIEKIIDDETLKTHQQISEEIMQFLNDPEALKHFQDNSVFF